MVWELIARYCEKEYDIFVNWEDEYFICPFCGEMVYKCDYVVEDYFLGHNGGPIFYCPICENALNGEED